MKTVFIYEQFTMPLEFIVFDGDYSHLDGVYFNNREQDPALHDELSKLLYDQDTGDSLYDDKVHEKFPVEEVKNGAIVIVCGFFP
jgi:hypothetical protein